MQVKMATKILNFGCSLFISIHLCSTQIFDNSINDSSSCKDVCRNTYTPHTYEKSGSEDSCSRGCRLFSMMEFLYNDINATIEMCTESCKEAYDDKENFEACSLGCKNQKPFGLGLDSLLSTDPFEQNSHMFGPFMYMHSIYSNILGQMMNQASATWSVYMQSSDGSIVIVKSPPNLKVIEFSNDDSSDGLDEEYNTASYLETNIEPLDNSATPFLKDSIFNYQRNDADIIDLSARDLGATHQQGTGESHADWLSCVAKKTGLPRLLLSWLLLMCSVVMIWLCLSASVTAPEHRVVTEPQKLSINGDQEVIADLLSRGIKPAYPQNTPDDSLPTSLQISVHRI